MRPQLLKQGPTIQPKCAADVLEYYVASHSVELHVTARGQRRKSTVYLGLNPLPGRAIQGSVSQVEPELGVLRADEIQDCQTGLAFRAAQTASELLQEHSRALGGTQH